MEFIELIKLNRVGDSNLQVRKSFDEYLDHSALYPWKPGDPVLVYEVRILIGTAPWSRNDLILLDTLNDSLNSSLRLQSVLRIDVFNFDDCTSQKELDQFIPGLRLDTVFHTPVVGIWRHGIHHISESGGVGRRLVNELLTRLK